MASSPIDVIRQYLVSLGFEVDKASYDTATKAIDSAGESLAKLAGTTVKNFGLATAAVTSFVTTAVVGMAKFLKDLGDAQIQYEMLAHQMWTTQQNAEAFSTTLKAMGRSLNDLYLSPTLMAQFQELNKQAFQMMPPAEYQQQMQFIQNITLQFTRMKLEGTYALQWIGYYFIKYMSGPLNSIYSTLTHLNDIIIKTMPYWTKVVAEVLSWFAQFGVTAVEALKYIGQAFNDIGKSIPKNIKEIGLALAVMGLLLSDNPIVAIATAIILLGLAVNDFFTYIHGGKSEFGAFWQKLIDLYNYLKDSGAIDAFKKNFVQAFKDISKFIGDASQDVKDFFKTLEKNGTIKNLQDTLKNTVDAFKKFGKDVSPVFDDLKQKLAKDNVFKDIGNDITNLIKTESKVAKDFSGLIDTIMGLKGTKDAIQTVGDILNSAILDTLKQIDRWINRVSSGLGALGDLLQGKWGDAWKNAKGIITGQSAATQQSYMYPSANQQTNNSNTNNMNVTQNIYGSSDPNVTANAASNNLTTIMRNAKGVIL